MKLLLAALLLLQGVKMTEDFLPLQVGNRWVYDVTTESGQKIGQMEFSVNERSIVSGRSVYAVSGFPFAGETAGAIRMIGYDREGRQFVRISGDQEFPLFSGDSESTEVLQSDTSGVAQRFALRTATTTIVFQRGVGIVEAKFQSADGVRIAKIATSSVGRPVAAPSAAVPAVTTTAAPPPSPAEPGVPGRIPVPNVAAVTEQNPVLFVSSESAPGGGLKLELLVVNTSDKLLPFRFNSSKTFDFVITDTATNQEVWRWSNRMVFAQVIRSDSIRASAKWTYAEVWNRRDNDKNPVPPGKYQLVGILASQPPLQSKPVMIDVP